MTRAQDSLPFLLVHWVLAFRLPSMSPETDAKDSMPAASQLEAADTLQGSLLAISGTLACMYASQHKLACISICMYLCIFLSIA